MTPQEQWHAALAPLVRANLPAPPAQVVEIGCGPLGGFVPMLLAEGHEAIGVDPKAPAGASYRRAEFETAELPEHVDSVIACASLHHVTDPGLVVERIAEALVDGGALVVVEWDWTAFDEPTARWCFERLSSDEEHGWLHRLRDAWADSGLGWDAFFREWAEGEGVHSGRAILSWLDRRFERAYLGHRPYFFPALDGTSEAEEQVAIDRGLIRANRIDYVARAAR